MRPKARACCIERLRELLEYDPATGVFRWRVSRYRSKAGAVAGTPAGGYVMISIDWVQYRAHRIAYAMMTGRWPALLVDHENGIKNDNRWKNLRQASNAANIANSKRRVDNQSGFKGVHFDKGHKRWRAKISVGGRPIDLGRHDSPQEAHAAYAKACQQYFGEFGRP